MQYHWQKYLLFIPVLYQKVKQPYIFTGLLSYLMEANHGFIDFVCESIYCPLLSTKNNRS